MFSNKIVADRYSKQYKVTGKFSCGCISSRRNERRTPAQRFQTAKTRQPKISSLDVVSRVFLRKFQPNHITSVSGHCMQIILKFCQTVADISMTSQFHEFLNHIFGGILQFGPAELRCCRQLGLRLVTFKEEHSNH